MTSNRTLPLSYDIPGDLRHTHTLLDWGDCHTSSMHLNLIVMYGMCPACVSAHGGMMADRRPSLSSRSLSPAVETNALQTAQRHISQRAVSAQEGLGAREEEVKECPSCEECPERRICTVNTFWTRKPWLAKCVCSGSGGVLRRGEDRAQSGAPRAQGPQKGCAKWPALGRVGQQGDEADSLFFLH